MILKRILVANWRSLLDEVEVGPFTEGLNVIHAPNGTGKSSLFEAMRRGLFDAHHVTGGEIAAVQPWGRDLTPSVTIEFIEGDSTWRVEKSFFSGKSAKLSRLEGTTFKPVADGREADERIREILSAEAPGRGLSKQEHWGLAQILWAPQGQLHLDKISGNAAESLKAALGIQVSGESGSHIEERIAERYLEFFTKTGGYKKGKNAAPVVALQEEKDRLAEQLVALREKHLSFEQTGHTVEDARQRRLQARREADALRDTVTTTRTRAEAYTRLKAEQTNKRESESLAKEKYETLTARQDRLQETRQQITGLDQSLKALKPKLEDLEKEATQAKEALAAQRTAREAARGKRSQLTDRQKQIETAREYLKHRESHADLHKRLGQLAELQQQQAQARQRLEAILAPTTKVIRELRKWMAQRDQATAALKASQIHLAITPESTVEITDRSKNTKTQVEAGKTLEIAGDDWVDIAVAGFGSLRASGPASSSEAHRAELEQAVAKIESLTQPYRTQDPDKLQEARDQADQLEREIKRFSDRMADLLDGDDLDDLKKEQTELQARLAETEKTHPEWNEQPPVLSTLQSEFAVLSQEIEDAIAAAEDAFDQAQSRQVAADQAVSETGSEQKLIAGQRETADRQLEELSSDGLSDADRKQAISDTLMSWQAAKAALEKAEHELTQFPDDPSKELDKLERQLVALEAAESKARDDEKTAEGQLQTLAAEGTYSKLVAAEEAVATLESEIAQAAIRMDAIRLLHETVSTCKSRILASVSAPVERSATRMLSRIVGPRLGQLKLTGDFVPTAVSPEIAAEPVPLHNLSGGEQEQLYLVARLALAEVLAKHQRQLVVLDDVLNATDSGRLARLLTLLEEVSDRLQIIILSCHPERYRALEGAEFFELKTNHG